ncbi:bifunctional non-homologous end joining protein LigD [Nocardioides marinisabuli]|uniref:DNA ligase (ATP) n=1 Tax=Nocardioides marinisabuli TaxID=419476 RepID=A0A7Y9F1P8_9ACTN|nr:non-homologous end-joining DNA ligase [Nocardioides marinisabuli]NYD58004.1 bifunctional non-homologous end joining protein LigD [Nocardioides marinisabuli]
MPPLRPMLATKASSLPTGAEWSHEVKWDGVRILADLTPAGGGSARLWSRNVNEVGVAWPDVVENAVGARDLLVDGEVIVLNGAGVPDFRVLQERLHVSRASTAERLAGSLPATFMVFDLLRLDGTDLSDLPLHERRARLADLDLGRWQVPAAYDDGAMLHAATLEQGLEGVVSKRLDSRYTFERRSPHWLKLAHRHRRSYVVGGWRPQEGSSDRLAALLVGEPTPDGLAYRGRVGSGIGARVSRQLTALVADLARDRSPFADEVPRLDARGTHWVEPVLVVDVDTHGTGHARLRQPSYRGLREDLAPADLPDQS